MPDRPISDEMLDAFVDRQLAPEDRLRILRSIATDRGLGQQICERQRIKELVGMAYREPEPPPRPVRSCGIRKWRWWRL